MGVSKNRGTPKSSILIGFSIINHPFWCTPVFGNTHIYIYDKQPLLHSPHLPLFSDLLTQELTIFPEELKVFKALFWGGKHPCLHHRMFMARRHVSRCWETKRSWWTTTATRQRAYWVKVDGEVTQKLCHFGMK